MPERAPRVLGVDEFAFRRGRRYGTILINVETGRVVDVLPDRTSETFATWLTAHPGAEIICRDRASAYTKAVKDAVPDALEIADRWHLLQNLSAAVEKTCHQHRPCLKKHAERVSEHPVQMPLLDALPTTRIVQRVLHHHAEVTRMVADGYPLSDIAHRLDLDRKTVRRYRDTSLDQLLNSARDRRPEQLDTFKPYLQQQFAAGHLRTDAFPADPRARIPRRLLDTHRLPAHLACRHGPVRTSRDPEPAPDHRMDHAEPRPPQRRGD
ncbi:transposase [Streptomyces sp. NPDC048479]|uniref:transposase n=1 Tax=Streptomyces sp. NPDC048479 TaxID=3154725 RepID=UPI003439BED1